MITLAQRARPLLVAAGSWEEAETLIWSLGRDRTANAGDDPLAELKARASGAWKMDMQPVSTALASALHSTSADALRGLQHMLPGLLREVNRAPSLVPLLIEGIGAALLDGLDGSAFTTANAIAIADQTRETDAMRNLRGRAVFETDMSSAELRGLSQELRSRIVFSARVTNAEFLQEVKSVVDDILSGKINQATGRLRLLRKLTALGYDPAVGFPGDMAAIPPAERGSLQDLSSQRRLDLLIETNVRMAQNYGRMIAGNQEYELREYPAWELVRMFWREIERGSPESKTAGWPQRWRDAGESVAWEGALETPMIARKDSPIWQALGDGAGGYIDTLLNPFPPFAFRSGMGWRAVPRAECIKLGLVTHDERPAPMQGSLAPSESSIVRAFDKLSSELQEELRRELADLE